MKLAYQNLQNDDPLKGRRYYWTHGRIWVNRRADWYDRRCGTLQVEWCLPCGHCGWGMTFGGGDSGRNLGITFAIPWLLSLHLTLENVFKTYAFGTDFDRGHDRQIACYFSQWALWYSIWVGSMASFSRDFPWCRWWRQGSIHFADLLGKTRYEGIVLKADIPLDIPMPEGLYRAVASIEQKIWKRQLWFGKTRLFVNVEIPNGIPFAGKGENSWDCGDDGLFSYVVEGTSLEHAIAHGVESVLASRRRYGMPSDGAIKEALS